jgi:hypothetical protein
MKARDESAINRMRLNTLKIVWVEIAGIRITKNDTNIE